MSTKGPYFDRGFDVEHPHSPSVSSPVVGRKHTPRVREIASWKKVAAWAMVAIMVVSAFALLLPSMVKPVPTDDEPAPARSEIGGTRDVTYTYSQFGSSFMKVSDNVSLGQHLGVSGINQWWPDRLNIGAYDDTIVRNASSPPYVLTYGPYGYNPPPAVLKAGFNTWTFYRMQVDALNLDTIQTGSNEDPLFLPVLGSLASDGGWINTSWHMTYLTDKETKEIDAGVHYANAYYGVPVNGGGAGGGFGAAGYLNDGWYCELSGKMDFNANAAKKFLGLPGTGDLRTEFTNANAGNALGLAWGGHWLADGSKTGMYDTYCAYLYSIDPVNTYLTLDPSSTATKLVVRIWLDSWGIEVLMDRYLDVTGVLSDWNYVYPEGLWLNLTMSPDGSDCHMSGYVSYNMPSWKDLNPSATTKDAAWLFEPVHSDYVNDSKAQHPNWISRMRLYIPSVSYQVKRENWMPGTVQFGNRVAYWDAPRNWNLAANEKIVIKLGNDPAWGIKPYKGASDTINPTKAAELLSNGVWGELVLGHTSPSSIYSATYYNHATKTLTLTGPMTFPRNANPIYTKLNETGTPTVPLAISRVSTYTVAMVEAGPYAPGVQYNVQITCLNFTGAAATGFHHNVTLSSDNVGTVFGETTHHFLPADSNVWQTTVVFGEARNPTHIYANSVDFPLDVDGSLSINVIPEFPTLLIPVMGLAAAVVVIARRRKQ